MRLLRRALGLGRAFHFVCVADFVVKSSAELIPDLPVKGSLLDNIISSSSSADKTGQRSRKDVRKYK